MILNADFILHGHTHRYRSELIKNTLVFNPGECAGILKGKNNIGLLDTEKKISEVIHFWTFFLYKNSKSDLLTLTKR